ncbi:membrane protein DedA with SNARE-associated domain [Microvirga flocculans]|uniref:Membrane protein DedA with SNARE-associated domain n=1 Tax=Microvirga flocculans TaxID=217168 RepID=A0A7W6N5Y8_9HYPH|nr:membrane protein DedA with SNARE-associated domain [Microvirga flocculans]
MTSLLQHGLDWIEPAIAAYGVPVLAIILYFESFGAPLPGESALIAASLLAARGDLAVGHVFLAAWLGAVLGDSTGYLIGLFGGRPLLRRFGPSVRLTPERLDRLEALAQSKGFFMVLTARFVVVLRQLNGLIAGSVGMPWPRFVVANVLGAALWAGLWSFGPYFFTDAFRQFL